MIAAVLALIEQLLPASASAKVVTSIIEALVKMMPFIVQEVESLIGPVKNIIAALSANPAALPDQLSQLQKLDKEVDDAFEAAASDTDAGD
jgi:phage-related minor tail protein